MKRKWNQDWQSIYNWEREQSYGIKIINEEDLKINEAVVIKKI